MRVLIVNVNLDPETLEGCEAIGARLAALAPEVEIRHAHWTDAPETVARWVPDRVVLGPNEAPFPAYPGAFGAFLAWLRGFDGALLGICGGHQVLALAHGASVVPVFDVPPATDSYEGMPKVSGAVEVGVCAADHPAFEGLPATLLVAASHVDQVDQVPAGFRAVATGDPCAIQAIAHEERPQLGVQFHPERPTDGGHGDILLRNWLAKPGPI